MRRLFTGILATIGLLTLLLVLGGGAALWWALRDDEPALPGSIVLTLDLRGPVAEGSPGLAARWLGEGGSPHLVELVTVLDRAAADPRVKAVYARLGDGVGGLATAQELRGAVLRLKERGKRTVAYADSFGELTPANDAYYLASAFDEIALQPVGSVGLTGLGAEEPFLADFLNRWGIGFEVVRRREYKTVMDNVAMAEPSEAHREMTQALLGSLDQQLREGIAQSRQGLADKLDTLLGHGPFGAGEALAAGLVDRVAHEDEVLDALRADGSPVAFADYAARAGDQGAARAKIGLVHAVGPIVRGGGGGFDEGIVSGDALAGTLAAALDDPELRVVVLRIASPGGSAVASEKIARAIVRLKAAGKKVIVSMGAVAGSGGYWIAADADLILADPATLTGSIGVVAGKPVLERLWQDLGVRWVTTRLGENAAIWSLNQPYGPAERARVDTLVDDIYLNFKEKVAAARGLSLDEVEEIARGRVWTGAQALPIRLVDRLGGLHDAIQAAKEKLDLPPDAVVELVGLADQDWSFGHVLRRLGRGVVGIGTLVQAWNAALFTLMGGAVTAPPVIR